MFYLSSANIVNYTPAKLMFSGVYWNQPVCPSVCPSVYKILVAVKGLARYKVILSYSSSFDWFRNYVV